MKSLAVGFWLMAISLTSSVVFSAPTCAEVFAASRPGIHSLLSGHFTVDPQAYKEISQDTIFPEASLNLANQLRSDGVHFMEVVSNMASQQAYIAIDTTGPSKINKLADTLMKRWKIAITLDPNLRSGIVGAYAGLNGPHLMGHLILRNFHGTMSTLYHETLHGALTSLEYKGVSHPLSVYFFRNKDKYYDGIAYGNYFSAQEIATFVFQGIAHPKDADKSLTTLIALSRIILEHKESLKKAEDLAEKNHKNMDMVGVKTELGEFLVPKYELEKAGITKEKSKEYVQKKVEHLFRNAEAILKITAPLTEIVGYGLAVKTNVSAEQKFAALEQMKQEIFSSELGPNGSLAEFTQWSELVWKPFMQTP